MNKIKCPYCGEVFIAEETDRQDAADKKAPSENHHFDLTDLEEDINTLKKAFPDEHHIHNRRLDKAFRDIDKSVTELKRLAYMDELTGCFSRHYVNSFLIDRYSKEWRDPQARYSLAIVDIDSFKTVNDRYGHGIGDRAICSVAALLRSQCRCGCGDCVIRYGGDEFILLFNGITRESFSQKLGEIIEGARNIRFNDCPDMSLTLSAGGELCSDIPLNYCDMINLADIKLYKVKAGGRDNYLL